MGSKARHIDNINRVVNMSDATIYVEPFLGSGVVFFNLERQFDVYILNEIQNKLLLFFKNFDKLTSKIIDDRVSYEVKNFNIENNKEKYYEYRKIFNTKIDTAINKTIDFFMLANTCINSMVRFGPNGFNQSYGNSKYSNKINKFKEAVEYCNQRKIIASNKDFKDVLRQVDKVSRQYKVFVFLDPPYISRKMSCSFSEDNCKYLCDWLLNTNVDFLYTDMDNKFIRPLKDRYKYRLFNTIRNVSPNRKTESEHEEIFISNLY